jgi:hypothetical protein
MAIGKKAVRKVKKAVKAVARVSPVELDVRKKGFLTAKNPSLQKSAKSTVKLLFPPWPSTIGKATVKLLVPPAMLAGSPKKMARAALGMRATGKGRGARLKPMKTPAIFSQNRLAKETGKRGLPEQQEARRRKVAQKAKTIWNIPTVLSRSPVQRPSKRFAVGATKPASPPKRRRRSKSN